MKAPLSWQERGACADIRPSGLCRVLQSDHRLPGRLGRARRHNPDLRKMHDAPPHRHPIPNGGNRALKTRPAIDDEELGPPQAALDEIIEHSAPSLGALAAHLLDSQENFLAVLAHAED